jgi:hypothetical protein
VTEGLTGEVILQTIFDRCIQPFQVWAHKMWRYSEPTNPTRELAKELADEEVDAWIKSILELGVMADVIRRPAPLHQGSPFVWVSIIHYPTLAVPTESAFSSAKCLVCLGSFSSQSPRGITRLPMVLGE